MLISKLVLYAWKTALDIRLLTPLTITDTLSLKLYLEYIRKNNWIAQLIFINKENAFLQYRFNSNIINTQRRYKPKEII